MCDVLQADGTAKGLCGLCVAFCEAQDHADAAPSGRILANYDKKRQPSDPAMPCIKIEDPCPCWTSAELHETVTAAAAQTNFSCRIADDTCHGTSNINGRSSSPTVVAQVNSVDHRINHASVNACLIRQYNLDGNNTHIIRSLRISEADVLACRTQINSKQAELALPCTITP